MVENNNRLSVEKIKKCADFALLPFGMPDSDLQNLTGGLIEASLRGIDTHGVRLLKTYVNELAGGRANPRPNCQASSQLPAVTTLDGDGGLGLVVGFKATAIAIEKAKTCGISAVSVGNSNHFGAAGIYSSEMAKAGMIGFSFSNADALVAPFEGNTKVTGTNPISMAAMAEDEEMFMLDLATSQVSYSKVMMTLAAGQVPREGWAVNKEGVDSSTGVDVEALQPLGGYKGQGLGMMVQILTAVLAGMPLDHQLSKLYVAPFDTPRKVAHFYMCVNIAALCDEKLFRSQLSELLKHYRQCDAIVPGDLELACRLDRQANGIPLDPETLAWFTDLQQASGG